MKAKTLKNKTLKKPPAKGGATKVGTIVTCSTMFSKAVLKVTKVDAAKKKITGTDTKTGKAVTYAESACTAGGTSTSSSSAGTLMDSSKPTPKPISKGTHVTCKTMFGTADFPVDTLNAKAKKVTGVDTKTKKKTTYSASSCTVGKPSGAVMDGSKPTPKEIKLKDHVACKTAFGSADFVVDSIDAKAKKVSGVNTKTKKKLTYSGSTCTVGKPS
ncbi:MAG: hypothetical protein EB127_22880, partial [Alphaproteobacteria bacterium]|nr:hypothetical protein [Alphaproteobacteria bacterium]